MRVLLRKHIGVNFLPTLTLYFHACFKANLGRAGAWEGRLFSDDSAEQVIWNSCCNLQTLDIPAILLLLLLHLLKAGKGKPTYNIFDHGAACCLIQSQPLCRSTEKNSNEIESFCQKDDWFPASALVNPIILQDSITLVWLDLRLTTKYSVFRRFIFPSWKNTLIFPSTSAVVTKYWIREKNNFL